MYIHVNREVCRGCGVCKTACPSSAIQLFDGKASIDSAKCTLCQACIKICPYGALQTRIDAEIIPAVPPEIKVSDPTYIEQGITKRHEIAGKLCSLAVLSILPRVIDVFTTYLEFRAERTMASNSSTAARGYRKSACRRRQRRQRRFSR